MTNKRKVLGRGLAALIPGASAPLEAAREEGPTGTLRTVGIEEIRPFRGQPRKRFDEQALAELADSIRNQGILQPLLVRNDPEGGYELIAGERRWRAAQRAGLHEVPVLVRQLGESEAFELAMVENLQRADLNPIEEAEGYRRLIDEFGYTQDSVAARVGKDRTTVTNALRLLKLPAGVRHMVSEGRLTMGHARALLALDSEGAMERLARLIPARQLSVRQVEALVKREKNPEGAEQGASRVPSPPSASAKDLTNRLQHALGVRVKVVESDRNRGHLEIHYNSLDELDRVLARLLP